MIFCGNLAQLTNVFIYFFSLNDANRSFFFACDIITSIFAECIESDKLVAKVLEQVLDKDGMISNIVSYYFHDISEENISSYMQSQTKLIRLIMMFG